MGDEALLRVLPEVFRTSAEHSAPLRAMAAVADDLHAPARAVLDHLDAYLDPTRCPDRFLGYLASWVDLDWLTLPDREDSARSSLPGGGAPLRDLVLASADLSARRGTPAGLVEFLRLATGVAGHRVDAGGAPFHVVVRVPAAAADQVDVVRRVVAALKPAHVTAQVVVDAADRGAGAADGADGADGADASGPEAS